MIIEGSSLTSVVPEYNGVWKPSNSDLEVGTLLNVIVKKVQDGIAFLVLESDDLPGELAVDEKGLFASDWMDSDDWVYVYDRLSLHDASTTSVLGKLGLLDSRMCGLEGLEVCTEGWRQALIGSSLVGISSVSA